MGRRIKAEKTANLKRLLIWLPALAGAASNQTKGQMPKERKERKEGNWKRRRKRIEGEKERGMAGEKGGSREMGGRELEKGGGKGHSLS